LNNRTFLEAGGILGLAVLIGIFFNLSNPNKIPFIGEEKPVDFSQSDSLMLALQKQDSVQRRADSLKTLSLKREDSLKTANEKRIKDSITAYNKQDSIKKVQDSVKAVKQKLQDSLKLAENKAQDFVKPLDIRLDFAKALYDKKYRFIDARDVEDYNAGHIQGAMNIPYHHFEQYKETLNGLPKDQVYVAYCSSSCDVSIDLAYAMAKMGFAKVYIFHGGWDEWKAAGYPVN
jgi:rhodanese-related sulfurtransferase